jgi:hypothetical protein
MPEIMEIEKAALNLPIGQRVWLAQSLLDSLPPPSQDLCETAEIEEAEPPATGDRDWPCPTDRRGGVAAARRSSPTRLTIEFHPGVASDLDLDSFSISVLPASEASKPVPWLRAGEETFLGKKATGHFLNVQDAFFFRGL